jgi:hypothetical protein
LKILQDKQYVHSPHRSRGG